MKWGITILFLSVLLQQDPWKDVYKESAWKDRDRWQRADELIRSLALKTESQVADVGCHEGYLTVKLAAIVGPGGSVYAVDVQQNKLDNLKVNLEKRNIKNVVTILGNYDDPKLPANTQDDNGIQGIGREFWVVVISKDGDYIPDFSLFKIDFEIIEFSLLNIYGIHCSL